MPLGDVDTVITLCAEECPVLPGAELRRESWALPDPAKAQGSEEEVLAAFRATRDEIKKRIEGLLR